MAALQKVHRPSEVWFVAFAYAPADRVRQCTVRDTMILSRRILCCCMIITESMQPCRQFCTVSSLASCSGSACCRGLRLLRDHCEPVTTVRHLCVCRVFRAL